jgi:hypothetical protein
MDENLVTRREAIARTALAGLLLPVLGAARRLAAAEPGSPPPGPAAGPRLNLGLAGYSLRKLSTDAAVAALREL